MYKYDIKGSALNSAFTYAYTHGIAHLEKFRYWFLVWFSVWAKIKTWYIIYQERLVLTVKSVFFPLVIKKLSKYAWLAVAEIGIHDS